MSGTASDRFYITTILRNSGRHEPKNVALFSRGVRRAGPGI
jgi:hypothetical protein